jgi:hypothetical protein
MLAQGNPADATAGAYLDWGVIHVSMANAVVVLLMLLVFVLALFLPFPGSGREDRR